MCVPPSYFLLPSATVGSSLCPYKTNQMGCDLFRSRNPNYPGINRASFVGADLPAIPSPALLTSHTEGLPKSESREMRCSGIQEGYRAVGDLLSFFCSFLKDCFMVISITLRWRYQFQFLKLGSWKKCDIHPSTLCSSLNPFN